MLEINLFEALQIIKRKGEQKGLPRLITEVFGANEAEAERAASILLKTPAVTGVNRK